MNFLDQWGISMTLGLALKHYIAYKSKKDSKIEKLEIMNPPLPRFISVKADFPEILIVGLNTSMSS